LGMILLINICKERLHYYEFVKPIEDLLKKNNIEFFTKNYKDVSKKNLKNCSKIIICGTSLKDNDFSKVENLKSFDWVKSFEKPILGICAGMQIIGLILGGKVKKKTEIGFYFEEFKKEFLGLSGKQEVFHLHNNYVYFSKLKEFDIVCGDEVAQAIKHKEKDIYGVLFHPEVRQKDLIKIFVDLK